MVPSLHEMSGEGQENEDWVGDGSVLLDEKDILALVIGKYLWTAVLITSINERKQNGVLKITRTGELNK